MVFVRRMINFTLDDVMRRITTWHEEAIHDKERAQELKDRIGHDLKSPTNQVQMSLMMLQNAHGAQNHADLIDSLLKATRSYASGTDRMASYITRMSILNENKHEMVVVAPQDGAQSYHGAVRALEDKLPAIESLEEYGGIEALGSYAGLVQGAIDQLVYVGNREFAPKQDEYRIELDVKYLLKGMSRSLQEKNISAESHVQPLRSEHNIAGDAIYHLITNVIDHATLKQERQKYLLRIIGEDRGDAYVLKVKDDGDGIDTGRFKDPNEVFGYLETRRADEGEHHGKGLFQVKKYIEDRGGSVKAKNNPEGGATFTLILPNNNFYKSR